MADPVRAAQNHLEPGEQVLATLTGRHVEVLTFKAALLATDRRVIYYGNRLIGHILHTFTYRQVDAVATTKGVRSHRVAVTAGGAAVRLDRVRSGEVDTFTRVVRDHTG